jgi:hypothetical protein
MDIREFIKNNKITISNVKTDRNPCMEDSYHMNHWRSTLKMGKKQMTIIFSQGFGITHDPKAEDIVNCLIMDGWSAENCRGLEDFCNEFGYEDRRKANKIYKAILYQNEQFKKFLGDLYDEAMDCETL